MDGIEVVGVFLVTISVEVRLFQVLIFALKHCMMT